MNRKTGLIAAVAVIGLCFAAASVRSEDEPGHAAMTPEQQKEMEMWAKLAAPGPQHERIQKYVGTWNTKVKFWHGPGEPEVSEGKSVIKSILGGRYIEEYYTGAAMGGPFEGRGIHGYDNAKKKHVAIWIDTMSTSVMIFEGNHDASGKALIMHADMVDHTGKKVHFRSVSRLVGDKEILFEMYRTEADGEEVKSMEIVYTRA